MTRPTAQFLTVDRWLGETGAPYNYAEDNPANLLDPTGMEGCGSIAVVSTLCNWGQESGVSNVAAGALDYLTLGMSTELAGDVFGFNADCTSFGSGGTLLGVVIGAFDGEDEAEIALRAEQAALRDIVDEATNGGRTALSAEDAKTVGEWASETKYPGARASSGDVGTPSNWKANPILTSISPEPGEAVTYRLNLAQNHGDG